MLKVEIDTNHFTMLIILLKQLFQKNTLIMILLKSLRFFKKQMF